MSNTNSLIQSMNMVSLEDEEEIGYEIIDEEEQEQPDQYFQGFNLKLCVVGHFIVKGKVDFLALQHTMAALWKPGKGVYIKELDTNLYLYQFFHEVDIKSVMEGCPWSFNRRAWLVSRTVKTQGA